MTLPHRLSCPLSEAVPGLASFTVTHKIPVSGESTEVLFDYAAVCAGQFRRFGNGNTLELARKLENLNRDCQAGFSQSSGLEGTPACHGGRPG